MTYGTPRSAAIKGIDAAGYTDKVDPSAPRDQPQPPPRRPVEIGRTQRLAEADRGRLEDAAAGAARRTPGRFEGLEMRRRVARRVAALAFDDEIGPVHFDEHVE